MSSTTSSQALAIHSGFRPVSTEGTEGGALSRKPPTGETESLGACVDLKPNTREEQGETGRQGKDVVTNQPALGVISVTLYNY